MLQNARTSTTGTVKELRLQTQTLNRLVVMGDDELNSLSFETFRSSTTSSKTWSDEMNMELTRLVSGIGGGTEDDTKTKKKRRKRKKRKKKKK